MIIPFASGKVRLTSPYGMRTLNGIPGKHNGYDLVGVDSKEVTAVEGGTVIYSRIIADKNNRTWEWGNYVCVQTTKGQYHYYCHLASRAVVAGQRIKPGDKIGIMGNTGYSFGEHLHFEARKADGRTPINPKDVLGIPNKAGVYEIDELDAAIDVLVNHGVINTPAYWRHTARSIKYLPDLIKQMAEVLKK